MFKPEILQLVPPFDEPPPTERPVLSTLTSLNPLAGHCAVIYAGNVFHLFSEENQLRFARALAGLLSPLPGSVIFGIHGSNLQKGNVRTEHGGRATDIFCHSTESWAAMWDSEAFVKGKVKVDATVGRINRRVNILAAAMVSCEIIDGTGGYVQIHALSGVPRSIEGLEEEVKTTS